MKRFGAVMFFALVCGCAGEVVTGGTGGGSGTTEEAGFGSVSDLPCEIATLVATNCAACHGATPSGGASFSLVSQVDFALSSPIDPASTIGQRSLLRMERAVAPMPPAPRPPVTGAALEAFRAWVAAGTPAGSCADVDAGVSTPVDAGPAPTDCPSGQFWTRGNEGSESMNPGMACRACHLASRPGRAYFFMGTVFASLHAKDRCIAPPPGGGRIEIIDSNGALAQTIDVTSGSGNFRSGSLSTTVQLPYTVRIVANGRTGRMLTPQMNGDCNSCHTEQGTNGAPGRIYWP